MIDTDGDKKIDEIRSLLERIYLLGPAESKRRAGHDLPSIPSSAESRSGPRPPPDEPVALSPNSALSQRDLLLAMEYREFLAGRHTTGLNPWIFLFATTLNTVVVAALAALVVSMLRQDLAGPGQIQKPTYQPPPASNYSTATLQRTIEIARIGTPDNPLRLEEGRPAQLPLRISPESAAAESYFLVLYGLPSTTILTGVNRIGSDSWLLPANASDKIGITVANPSNEATPFAIQLRHLNGSVAAETEGWLVVSKPAVETPPKADPALIAGLIAKSEQMLSRGDIVAARTLYQRAAEAGSADAALALGATYDPNRLWVLGVFGMAGNKERARQWYLRADQLGHPDAKDRLVSLGN